MLNALGNLSVKVWKLFSKPLNQSVLHNKCVKYCHNDCFTLMKECSYIVSFKNHNNPLNKYY